MSKDQNQLEDGKSKFLVCSLQWGSVIQFNSTFKDLDLKLYMGLVANGINSFGNQSRKYLI
jgi:hypothetical protein